MPDNCDYSDDQIWRIVCDVARRRSAGENLSDDWILANNPSVPKHELEQALRRLQIIAVAQANGAVAAAKTTGSENDSVLTVSMEWPAAATTIDDHILPETIARYRPVALLGEGTFGTVYKAYDPQHDCFVALKISKTAIVTREQEAFFFREARAAAQLSHPGIVHIRDSGRDGDRFFIASEYVEGSTLEKMVHGKSASIPWAVQIASQICDALEHAHTRGVIHRDLKPANVIVDRSGLPRLMDFGLAKRVEREATLTVDGNLIGTIPYMSPQQAEGAGRLVDGRSDVYSLGVVLFEMITGERPFRGTALMIHRQVLSDQPPSPRSLNDGVPLDLNTIVLRCLEKQPEQRFTARELKDELLRFQQGEPIKSRPIPFREKAWRWGKRRPALSGLILAVTMLITTMLGAGVREIYTQRRAKAQLSDNLLATAELYGRRGEWRKALSQIDKADQVGHVEPIRVNVARLTALNALNRVEESRELLEALDQRRDLGAYRAEVTFHHGIHLLTQDNNTAGAELLRKAKVSGQLSPARVALIDALTATTSSDALAKFELSLAEDPFSQEAHSYVVFALAMAGRYDEALQRARTAMQLFPDDPNLPLFAAYVQAMNGDLKQAETFLNSPACKQLEPELLTNYRKIIQILPRLYEATFRLWDFDPPSDGSQFSAAEQRALSQIQTAIAQIGSREPHLAGAGGPFRLMEGKGPICYQTAYKVLDELASLQTIGFLANGDGDLQRIDALIQSLEESSVIHPDAYFEFCRGRLLFERDRFGSASLAFRKAADRQSIFRIIPQLAYYCTARCEYERFKRKDTASLNTAITYIRKMISFGGVSSAHAEVALKIAIAGQDYQSARSLIGYLDATQLGKDEVIYRQAEIEFEAGNYIVALELAKQIPADGPKALGARQIAQKSKVKLLDIVGPAENNPVH